ERDGVWHDSHAHPVPRPVLDILTDLASRVAPPGVLLERDENFPAPEVLKGELDAIAEAVERGHATGTGRPRGTAARTGTDAGSRLGSATVPGPRSGCSAPDAASGTGT
ncbi:DUF692 family protein, partial [Streptomyces sp. SID625]|nr:DUF692 family protein [Streptomyces sp. SID625]